MTIWDRGTYELHKWEERKVEVTFHGERLEGRYGLFPLGRPGEDGKDWMIHRMDPPQDPDAGGDARADRRRCSRGPGSSRPTRRVGRSRSSGTASARSPTSSPGGCGSRAATCERSPTAIPELRGILQQTSMRELVLDGEIVAFDDAGRPSFSRAAAADARDRAGRGAAAGGQHAGGLRDLRPAVLRRPLADGAALRAAARAARGARARRTRLEGAGGPPRPRPRAARGSPPSRASRA